MCGWLRRGRRAVAASKSESKTEVCPAPAPRPGIPTQAEVLGSIECPKCGEFWSGLTWRPLKTYKPADDQVEVSCFHCDFSVRCLPKDRENDV